ncbi:hypothetical protein [Acidibrevibacterium fodinaquatile]|uniref:hypothetical protein n=1 Tax=Acidibrevibacterium fodinaquatile TaxID=1969806 RepID=UPI0019653453|nr:hypothetical protein [Acidibrevibacterium fodinaquatile]
MSAPACETRTLAAPFPTPIACLLAGQTEAERWLRDHPSYRLQSWRCGREEKAL